MAKHVEYDPYWQKMCYEKLGLEKLPAEHSTWRSAYFSKYIQNEIENISEHSDIEGITELLKVMAPATFQLRVDKAKSTFNINDTLSKLTKLQYLRLTLVKKDARSNFNIESLGMTLEDINNVANLIPALRELKVIELPCNQIDDSGVKMLIKSFEEHPCIETIDLSHNKISNEGARRMARTVKHNRKITKLNLSNNKIGYEGGRSLSLMLAEPDCQLADLNLSLNLIGDKALIIMLEDIKENKSLKVLDLSANLLTDEVIVYYSSQCPTSSHSSIIIRL